jgi:hypothetical protein
MNGRILELLGKASHYAHTKHFAHVKNFKYVTPDQMSAAQDTLQEKFAELIVRECTNMLPEDSVRDTNGVHMFYVIRKHFGVSEIGR